MICDICEKTTETNDGTVMKITGRGNGEYDTVYFDVCPVCRERILQTPKLETLTQITRSLALGSFRDTVA